jgi:hypothetical protein
LRFSDSIFGYGGEEDGEGEWCVWEKYYGAGEDEREGQEFDDAGDLYILLIIHRFGEGKDLLW